MNRAIAPIEANGIPELIEAVKDGRLAIHVAESLVRFSPALQRAAMDELPTRRTKRSSKVVFLPGAQKRMAELEAATRENPDYTLFQAQFATMWRRLVQRHLAEAGGYYSRLWEAAEGIVGRLGAEFPNDAQIMAKQQRQKALPVDRPHRAQSR
jgi:hypothetical protein